MDALDEAEDDLYGFHYSGDYPAALGAMIQAMSGGLPSNQTLGPVQQLKVLAKAAEYRAATPRRPGKGKPLPPSAAEGEQEVETRRTAQKACQRLIVPKAKNEKPETFIRRLDAHRNAQEALIAPQGVDETEMMFAKRCAAIKNNEHPNAFIPPKEKRESEGQFEERLKKAETLEPMLFPIGTHETDAQWKARVLSQKQSKLPIMPRSDAEPERGFRERCELQRSCVRVIHPYDCKREDEKVYFRRLHATKERPTKGFCPGDAKAIDAVLGPPSKHAPKVEHHDHHVDAAAIIKEKMAEVDELQHEEEEKAQKELEEAKAAEQEKADEEERVQKRLADMKLAQEEQRHKQEEAEANKEFGLEKICITTTGFMPLKKLLIERGVPKEQVSACANKFALMEVAKKWATELKIEWVDEAVEVS